MFLRWKGIVESSNSSIQSMRKIPSNRLKSNDTLTFKSLGSNGRNKEIIFENCKKMEGNISSKRWNSTSTTDSDLIVEPGRKRMPSLREIMSKPAPKLGSKKKLTFEEEAERLEPEIEDIIEEKTKIQEIEAQPRDFNHKKLLNTARGEGMVPASIFGKKLGKQLILVRHSTLSKFAKGKEGFIGGLYYLNINGQKELVMAHDLDIEEGVRRVIHVNFMRITKEEWSAKMKEAERTPDIARKIREAFKARQIWLNAD
eukprot:TRINITY_DN2130_c0_g1_i1.p1 TRINITY_DN2130_c0_g1~~TRINITY_DN2130_c0_g1_i1.p1  ORF type:complete len:257 (+),score=106.67 TRINITY_DN2130_c0_g1_i1:107-877(+)